MLLAGAKEGEESEVKFVITRRFNKATNPKRLKRTQRSNQRTQAGLRMSQSQVRAKASVFGHLLLALQFRRPLAQFILSP